TSLVTHLAFAPDGRTLASADRSGIVRLWDAVEGQEVLTLDGPSKPLGSLDFSPDGRTLGAYVPSDRSIILWHGGRE
ncbi:WD40 repeat domain-containing protein, partial [Singulisphaera rosea]